jgi:hypothetical protein
VVPPQGDDAGWTETVRLVSEGAVGRDVALEGLRGGTRVEEVVGLAAASLGVRAGEEVALLFQSRLLLSEATLEEACVLPAAVIDVWVGEGGGMPGADPDPLFALAAPPQTSHSIFAPPPQGSGGEGDAGLLRVVEGLLGAPSSYESGIEGAAQRVAETRSAIARQASAAAVLWGEGPARDTSIYQVKMRRALCKTTFSNCEKSN